jgi:hypothetical protein
MERKAIPFHAAGAALFLFAGIAAALAELRNSGR